MIQKQSVGTQPEPTSFNCLNVIHCLSINLPPLPVGDSVPLRGTERHDPPLSSLYCTSPLTSIKTNHNHDNSSSNHDGRPRTS